METTNEMEIQRKLIQDMCTKSTHVAILGKREEGKTSLGMAILDWHRLIGNKECLIYSHPQPHLLPNWIKNITDLRYMTNNQVILIDESSSDFDKYSYAKQSNRYLMQKLKKARQLNNSFVFVDHASDFLNKNMLKLIDIWMLKNNTEYSIEDERPFIRKLYSRMERVARINEFWMHTEGYQGIMQYKQPLWYTAELSKAYDVHDMQVTPVDELINMIKGKVGEVGENVAKRAQNELEKRLANKLVDTIMPKDKPQQKIKKVTESGTD